MGNIGKGNVGKPFGMIFCRILQARMVSRIGYWILITSAATRSYESLLSKVCRTSNSQELPFKLVLPRHRCNKQLTSNNNPSWLKNPAISGIQDSVSITTVLTTVPIAGTQKLIFIFF